MPTPDPIEDRPSRFGSPLFWTLLVLVPLAIVAAGVATRLPAIYRAGLRYEGLARRSEGWARALASFEPADPAKRAYVRQLSAYYRQLGRNYEAAHRQPWLEFAEGIEPPDRPAHLPGTPDPATGAPPEVAEAIDNLAGSVAGVDPATRSLGPTR